MKSYKNFHPKIYCYSFYFSIECAYKSEATAYSSLSSHMLVLAEFLGLSIKLLVEYTFS